MAFEFIAVFVVTLFVLIMLVLGLHFGKPPTYRPEREQVIQLLKSISRGNGRSETWALFLGVPIHHDLLLEGARQKCLLIDEQASEGLAGAVYDKAGREQINNVLTELLAAIEKEPVTREF